MASIGGAAEQDECAELCAARASCGSEEEATCLARCTTNYTTERSRVERDCGRLLTCASIRSLGNRRTAVLLATGTPRAAVAAAAALMEAIIVQHLLSTELQSLEIELARRSASSEKASGLLRMQTRAAHLQTQADCKHLEVTLQAARCEHTAADTARQRPRLGQSPRRWLAPRTVP